MKLPARIFALVVLAMLISGNANRGAVSYGLLRSVDGGESWRDITEVFQSNRVNSLAITTNQIWAATDQGLFASLDQGESWKAFSAPREARFLSVLAVDGVVLAGTERDGLWRSEDAGVSWTKSLPRQRPLSLIAAKGKISAGLNRGGAAVSEDGGKTWRNVSAGLPESAQVFQLSATSTGHVYAALYANGMYALRGETWTRLGNDKAPKPLGMVASENVLLAGHNPGGMYRSLDGGETWTHNTESLPGNAPTWMIEKFGTRVFHGTTGLSGLYVSDNDGLTWRPAAAAQLHNRAVVAMASDGKTLLAATVDHVMTTGLKADLNGVESLGRLQFP
jgi:photosystem II stability/assembly factor-like uncharacterized protein